MNEKYTFEDWLNDEENFHQVYVHFLDEIFEVGRTGNYPTSLLNSGEIEKEEYDKIREAQKSAYDIVVNYHIEKRLNQLSNNLANAPDKSNFLNHRKKIIQAKLDSADPEKMEVIYAGEWSALRLDPQNYKKIMERHKEGLEPQPLHGVEEQYLSLLGPYPDQKDIRTANIQHVIDEHFKLTILYRELLEIERELSLLAAQINSSNDNSINTSEEISTKKIYQKYHALYNDGEGMKQFAAYEQVESWLLNDLDYTREEVKEKWNITLELDAFTRSARNNRY